jgi:serine/threonine-protein kinase
MRPGEALGPYRILEKLGEGGMGEVYRAHDTKLNRDVAIKVLPDSFANDADRLARFTREAQTLASLNHLNIAHIHGLEESPPTGSGQAGGVRALVMELVEGEDLSQRIARGAIPLDEALPIAKQIAEALEAAHELGIIHRDLKPANVKVRDDGMVKVLDFGLAKALEPVGSAAGASMTNAPTITSPAAMTHQGVILGTAAYMPPEQAKGRAVDKRADLWAFGAVLFEMLSGKRAFEGEDVTDTIVAVLSKEPAWDTLPPATPHSIRKLLRRCLEKDRKRRLDSIADARLEIEDALSGTAEPQPPAATPARAARRWLAPALGVVAGAAIAAAVFALRPARPLEPRRVVRLAIDVPASRTLQTIALAPDGSRLAYVATEGGRSHIYVRALDQAADNVLPGTDDATAPFFSPDGQWIAFFASGRLKKIPVAGGEVVSIADAKGSSRQSGTWAADGTIVFSSGGSGLLRVAASGGTAVALTVPATANGDVLHWWPRVLPDGQSALFTVTSGRAQDMTSVDVVSLGNGTRRSLLQNAALAQYLSTGHLLYAAEGRVVAARFEPSSSKLDVTAIPVLDEVGYTGAEPLVAVSAAGDLAYAESAPPLTAPELVRVDRRGVVERLSVLAPGTQPSLSLSPDGTRLAVIVSIGREMSAWIVDVQRGTQTRFPGAGNTHVPVWLPDGLRLVFSSDRAGGAPNLFVQPADGSGTAERLVTSSLHEDPGSWSRDGRWLAYAETDPKNRNDLWAFDADARRAMPFRRTAANEQFPALSPDGRWVAYRSDESGRLDVYAEAFPGGGSRVQLSVDGGTEPIWAATGQEVFYRNAGRLMSVAVKAGSALSAAVPAALFEGAFLGASAFGPPGYAATADGQHFYFLRGSAAAPTPRRINVIVNWLEEFKRRLATK